MTDNIQPTNPSDSRRTATVVVLSAVCLVASAILVFIGIRERSAWPLLAVSCLAVPATVRLIHGQFRKDGVLFGYSLALGASILLSSVIAQFDDAAMLVTYGLLWPVLIGFLIASIVHVVRRRKEGSGKAALPLGINMLAVAAVLITGQILRPMHLYLLWRLEGCNEVISLIQNDQLQPGEYGFVDLPGEYRYLSDEGSLRAEERDGAWSIFFYRTIGFQGTAYGYLYRSGGAPPVELEYCKDWHALDRAGWFYCGESG